MASDGVLHFDTRIDESGFNKGIKSLSKNAKGISGILKGIGVAAVGMIAVNVTKKLTQIADQAIELSSDMQEVQNVVDTAFGSMAYKAEEFADNAIEGFGMSKLAAKQTASTYMSMGKSMGLSMDAASDMAIETAKLTGDVASFYNISQDLAAVKLKGIWTGETEALKDLGVVMTEANLQQFALNEGITKSFSSMTQAEKVALRYNYVMSTLADAQGDFARTSDSWANQTRVLSERWKELLSIVGGGLIRVLTPVIGVINTIMQALINLANAFSKTLGQLFGWNKEVKVSGSVATDAAGGQDELAGATESAGEAASGATAAFDKLDVLQSDSTATSASGGVSSSQVEVVDSEPVEANTGVIDALSQKIKDLQPYVDRLKDAWNRLKTAFSEFWTSPGVQAIVGFFKDLFTELSTKLTASFITILAGAFDALAGAINFVAGFLSIFVGLIKGDFSMVKDGFKTAVGGMKTALYGLGTMAEGVLIAIIGTKGVEAIKKWLAKAKTWVTDTKLYTGGIKGALQGVLTFMTNTFGVNWGQVWDGVKTVLSGLITFVKGAFTADWKTAWGGIKTIISGINTFISGAFSTAWQTAWDGVTTIFKNVWNSIIGIVESAVNKVISAINWCLSQLNKISIKVPDWVKKRTGMDTFGFSIPLLNSVEIPRLATGAVIPPNSEFLAMLGDQRSGNNIEAPEGLIRQIVREESGSGNIVINAKGSMGQLIRMLKLEIDREDNRRGGSFVPGGVY